jgi:membrane protease YdiL (CAAX protease family)
MADDMTQENGTKDIPRWRWWLHLILLGGFFMPGLVFARQNAQPALTNNSRGLLIASATNLAVFALVFTIAWFSSRATREQMFLKCRPGWLVAPLGIGYSIAIRIVVAVVGLFVVAILLVTHVVTMETLQHMRGTKLIDVEKVVDKSAMQHQPVYFWLTVTFVSFVVAGLREELWRGGTLAAMRALWPRAFGTRAGEIAAISIIALIFGAAHIGLGPVAAVVAALLGFLLGLIIVLHRSVWPAVLAHGFFDALSLGLLPFVIDKLQ